jgi:tetratricopeptide (TPR) repeat protein
VRLGDFNNAINAYKEATRLDTTNAEANYNLGFSYRQIGKHSDALNAFKRATELKPDWAEAFMMLGETYEDLGDHEKFLQALEAAYRLDPISNSVQRTYGTALRSNRKYVEAIEPLKKASAAQPNDVDALYLLANTYFMARKYDEANEALSRVLVLDPNHVLALDHLRVAALRKDLLPKLAAFQQRVRDEPQSSSAREQLAQTYNSLGMNEEAEQEYLKAIEVDPSNYKLYGGHCVNYSEWHKYDKAVECYQKALKLNPNHVYYMSLGNAYADQGKLDEAIDAYNKSLEKKPTFTFSLYQLGYAYFKKGQAREAVEPLRKLIAIEPNHIYGNHLFRLGLRKSRREDSRDATVLRAAEFESAVGGGFVEFDSKVECEQTANSFLRNRCNPADSLSAWKINFRHSLAQR